MHKTVLADAVVDYLAASRGGVFCDGTLGGGGHTERVLTCSDTRVIALDRDPSALDRARDRLAYAGDRLRLVHRPFSELPQALAELNLEQVDGIVLDLGISSDQLDTPGRGFSFQTSGPLDMRMDPGSEVTARQLIRDTPEPELADLIYRLGEERYSRRIARSLKGALRASRLETTADLASEVERCIPAKSRARLKIHPATRTFQALRIAVNRELDELEAFLEFFPDLLRPGGRCVVIAFHSLEDRLVKHRFRDLARTSTLPEALAREAGERTVPLCRVVTRRPIYPSPEEIAINPRARSARLRCCEKVLT